jgi:uncharacterized protein with PQ loop repeat
MEILGWVGGLCLAVCAFPQAVKVHKDKNADGTSHGMLWLWMIGEVFTLLYVLLEKFSYPLLINYSLNIVFVAVIFYYKYLYGKTNRLRSR